MARTRGIGVLARFAFGSLSALLSLACFARPAAAQTQAMEPSRGMVRTHVGTGGRAFSVYFGRGERPIADCDHDCDFWAWPGKYRVVVFQGEGPNHDARLALRIAGAGHYSFVPANGQTQNAGIVLGVAGPVLGLAGLVLSTVGVLGDDRRTALYVGLGGMAAGATMTGVGWWLYAENRARFELAPPPPGALGLGAALRF